MTSYPKIFKQHIAGEDISSRELFKGVSIFINNIY